MPAIGTKRTFQPLLRLSPTGVTLEDWNGAAMPGRTLAPSRLLFDAFESLDFLRPHGVLAGISRCTD